MIWQRHFTFSTYVPVVLTAVDATKFIAIASVSGLVAVTIIDSFGHFGPVY